MSGFGLGTIKANSIVSSKLLTRTIPSTSDILLVGDSREDSQRVPAVNGIRTTLSLTAQADPIVDGGQVWAKGSLRVTHIGGGYNPASDLFYGLNDLATLSSGFNTIVYRLGVNDINALSGTDLMWQVAMTNAHMNILGSTATRLTYSHAGTSAAITASQTRGFVQVSASVNVASCSFAVTAGTWYVALAGFRTTDVPDYRLSVSDGTLTRYFNFSIVGMASFASVLRFPIYWYAENTGTLTFTNTGGTSGIWYMGEAYSLASKSNSSFVYVGETNWNGQVNSEDYFELLRRVHTQVIRSARMPWISFKHAESINWCAETDSEATADLGHYTNPHMLTNSVKLALGIDTS